MSWDNADKVNELFNKLTDKEKLDYYESMFGTQLYDIWRNWEDNLVEEQIEEFEDMIKRTYFFRI